MVSLGQYSVVELRVATGMSTEIISGGVISLTVIAYSFTNFSLTIEEHVALSLHITLSSQQLSMLRQKNIFYYERIKKGRHYQNASCHQLLFKNSSKRKLVKLKNCNQFFEQI